MFVETTDDSFFLPNSLTVCGGLQFRQRQMQGTRFDTGEALATVIEEMLPVFPAHLLQMVIVLVLVNRFSCLDHGRGSGEIGIASERRAHLQANAAEHASGRLELEVRRLLELIRLFLRQPDMHFFQAFRDHGSVHFQIPDNGKLSKRFEQDFASAVRGIFEKNGTRQSRMAVDPHGAGSAFLLVETGELKTVENIRKASELAILAGADFIKTSTGKVPVAATPLAAIIMIDTIKEYYEATGKKVGFKPAGGMKTPEDALTYYYLVKNILGEQWLNPNLFRVGTSRLARLILEQINHGIG